MYITEDELLLYLKNRIRDYFIASFDNTDLLVWGSRKNDSVRLLGVTINIGVKHLQDTGYVKDERVAKAMQVAHLLSQKSQLVFFRDCIPWRRY